MTDYELDVYDESPLMPPYLVAYVIADFAFTETKCCDGKVVIRVIGRKGAVGQMDFAKTLGRKAIQFYEGYFDNKFKLSKLDMLAIPDFGFQGMENWGLVIFRYVNIKSLL